MGSKVYYSEKVIFKAVQMKQEGYPVKVIMDGFNGQIISNKISQKQDICLVKNTLQ